MLNNRNQKHRLLNTDYELRFSSYPLPFFTNRPEETVPLLFDMT